MGKAASFRTSHAQKVRFKPVTTKPNLREQQRVSVSMEATVDMQDGSSVTCRVANLSRAGLMLTCDLETVKTLIPSLRPPAPGRWIAIKIRFTVPVLPMQPVSVTADGHIVHMRRISRDEFHLGIQFAAFENNGYEHVDRYVSHLLSKAHSRS